MQTIERPAAITPQPDETYEDFAVRAHTALIDRLPDPAERNAAVWGLWEQTNGDSERQRADARFGEGYKTVPMVPLFIEHEKVSPGPNGTETVTNYDVTQLAAIVRENNFRIEDTDAYTGLVDKHTVPAGHRDPMPPKTLGYVGPYRIGMLGRKHPRFAIFADEHHRKDRALTLSDRPRRSVEVLKLKANGRRYIDPIACLAEAPRLPLPVHHYTAAESDVITERYQALAPAAGPLGRGDFEPEPSDRYDGGGGGGAAASIGGGSGGAATVAYPGGGNTFITKQLHTKDRNAAGVGKAPDMHDQDPAGTVRQVIDALQSTEEWAALTQLVEMMKAQDAPMDAGEAGGAAVPEAMTGDDPAAGGEAMPVDPAAGGGPLSTVSEDPNNPMGVDPAGLPGGGGPMGGPAAPMEYPEGMESQPNPAMEPPAMGGGAPLAEGAGIGAPPLGSPPLGQPAGETPGMPALGEDAAAADQTLLADPQEPDRNNPLAAVPLIARAAAPAVGRAVGGQAAKAAGGGPARQAIAGAAGRAAGAEATTQLGDTLARLRANQADQNGIGSAISTGADAAEELAIGPLAKPATGNSRFSATATDAPAVTKPMGGSYNGHHRYQAPNPEDSTVNQSAIPTVDQYNALAAENAGLHEQLAAVTTELESVSAQNGNILTEQAEHYAALQYQVVELTQDRTDSTRRGRLVELASRLPVVNVEEEATRCLYSAGAEMTDADFESHMDTIERYAAQSIVASPMVPVGIEAVSEPNQLDVETARYAATDADRALEIVNESLRAGDRIDYPTAVAKAKAERVPAAA